MIPQAICSYSWRQIFMLQLLLCPEVARNLNSSSPFLNRCLYCTLKCHWVWRKTKELFLNHQYVCSGNCAYFTHWLLGFFVFVFLKCIFGLDQTKGRSLYCVDTECMKVTLFCHTAYAQVIHRQHFARLEVSTSDCGELNVKFIWNRILDTGKDEITHLYVTHHLYLQANRFDLAFFLIERIRT